MLPRMWLGVLGPTVVRPSGDAEGAPTELKAAKHRALLAALALQPGRPMSADALVEAIWGVDAPPSAQATLHTYLSVVRRTLEPDLPPRAPSRYLVSSDLGYELRLPDGGLDVSEFSRVVGEVHTRLGPRAAAMAPELDETGTATELLDQLDRALAERPDYVAFGPIFATPSKLAHEPTLGLEMLARAAERAHERGIPLVAIGGLPTEHAGDLARRGVVAAMIGALVTGDLDDVETRARWLQHALA